MIRDLNDKILSKYQFRQLKEFKDQIVGAYKLNSRKINGMTLVDYFIN